MKLLRSLKIGSRLIVSFTIVIAFMLAIGMASYFSVSNMAANANEMYEKNLKSVSALGKMEYIFMSLRLTSYKIDSNGKTMPEQGAEQQKLSDESFPAMEESLAVLKDAIVDGQDQKNYDDLKALLEKYKVSYANTVKAHMDNSKEELQRLIPVNAGNGGELNAKLLEIVDHENKQAMQNANKNKSTASFAILLVGILSAVGIVVSMLISLLITGSIAHPVRKLVEGVERLAAGDAGFEIQTAGKDEISLLSRAVSKVADSIRRLTEDTVMLAGAGSEGRLSIRADASRHQGEYRKIVEGVNNTLDAVIGPLNVASEQLERMAAGADLPVINTDQYHGDFKAVITNLNKVRESIYLMLEDSGTLVQAAAEGRLSARADVARHKGAYATLIKGINDTLDAVVAPINEAATVLTEMSQGNLGVNVTGNYRGDHAVIKNAMNDTINTVKSYIVEISHALAEVAGGNMDVTIDRDYRGEFVEIKYAINNISDSLSQVLGDINAATEQVAAGSAQVSAGSQALSQGATEQAGAIEQLTSSLSDIAAQTRQNAVNANQASELAVTTRNNAVRGNEQMKEMQQAMAEINESSANISRIIKVIDEIAFQTNLLALNAAVEAARAGQQGKGFAVVAEEVRNLAQRSANAAKETTAMIEESIKKVKVGTRMADETATALNRIVNDVEKATNLVSNIASASNDQASAIAQVNKGIEQVSMVVQSNSATAEESAATSEQLSGQAALVKEMVGRFSLRGQSLPGGRKALMTEPVKRMAVPEKGQGKPSITLNAREFGKY